MLLRPPEKRSGALVTIETCPYRCRMYWYAANWHTKNAFVFNTKAEAVRKARALAPGLPSHHIINVSWIDNSMGRIGPQATHLMQQCIGKDYVVSSFCR